MGTIVAASHSLAASLIYFIRRNRPTGRKGNVKALCAAIGDAFTPSSNHVTPDDSKTRALHAASVSRLSNGIDKTPANQGFAPLRSGPPAVRIGLKEVSMRAGVFGVETVEFPVVAVGDLAPQHYHRPLPSVPEKQGKPYVRRVWPWRVCNLCASMRCMQCTSSKSACLPLR